MSKILVAYFSASGVTARAAQAIAAAVGGDLYEIAPAQPYTAADLDWTNKQSRSSLEMGDTACLPALAAAVENVEQYDTVFVGFPIWWGIEPRAVDTFLESGDFSGKVFCSNLDGEYLYAWEYKNGVRQKLRTVNGFNLTVALWDDKPASYTVIRINEASPTSAGTYSYDETGGSIGWGGTGGSSGGSTGGGNTGDSDSGSTIVRGYTKKDLELGKIGRQQIMTDLVNDNVSMAKVVQDKKNPIGIALDATNITVSKYSIIVSALDFLDGTSDSVLAAFGRRLGIVGGLIGVGQSIIAFTDGEITPTDLLGAVSSLLSFASVGYALLAMPYVAGIVGITGCVIGIVTTIYGLFSQSRLFQIQTENGTNIYVYIPANPCRYA